MAETKSSGMVERVAVALARLRIEQSQNLEEFRGHEKRTPEEINETAEWMSKDFITEARVAIAAMQEPTDAMMWAGATASDWPSVYADGPSALGMRRVTMIYRAALEEALYTAEP